MRIAILDPFSGIAGDMTIGALLDAGLDPEWLRALPARLGLDQVSVRIERVRRAGISATKVEFDIPPQPHGRHLSQIRKIVSGAALPEKVRAAADEAFTAIASVEAEIHGTTVEKVHLHEVGAVDAILDIVGSIGGFHELGIERIFCGPVSLGDGTVRAAHGVLAVPVPATMRLLEGAGVRVRPGPPDSGELVTPTGAALVKVLSRGAPPAEYLPVRSGYGAGTKDFADRANVLRIVIAEEVHSPSADGREPLVMLACDVDDMSPEYLAGAAERIREGGALDVTLTPTIMKKGRPGTRIEVLATVASADAMEALTFSATTTIGVRRWTVERRALPREEVRVQVEGGTIRVKATRLPSGAIRAKPEADDVRTVAAASGQSEGDIFRRAVDLAEREVAATGTTRGVSKPPK